MSLDVQKIHMDLGRDVESLLDIYCKYMTQIDNLKRNLLRRALQKEFILHFCILAYTPWNLNGF